MEPIQPSNDPADAGTPLGRFKKRFGNRMHSIAWYVDDIEAFTARLLDNDIRLIGLKGQPVTDPKSSVAVWTHPGDTGALLEFCEPGFASDPRLKADFDIDKWARHPLALTHTSHVTVLVDDLADAARVYGAALGGTLLSTDLSDSERPRSFHAVGSETVIEAVAPTTDTTPEGADHQAAGNAVHAITFATADLAGARDFLASKELSVTVVDDHHVWIDLDPGHGLRVGLTDSPVRARQN